MLKVLKQNIQHLEAINQVSTFLQHQGLNATLTRNTLGLYKQAQHMSSFLTMPLAHIPWANITLLNINGKAHRDLQAI